MAFPLTGATKNMKQDKTVKTSDVKAQGSAPASSENSNAGGAEGDGADQAKDKTPSEARPQNPDSASDANPNADGVAGNITEQDAAAAQAAAEREDVAEAERKSVERKHNIFAAIALINPSDKSSWTKSGKPELKSLRDIMQDESVTSAERDEAWELYQVEQAKARDERRKADVDAAVLGKQEAGNGNISCEVLYPIRRQKKTIKVGQVLPLPEKEARNLLALGAVRFVSSDA
jgi:hypothetical protein